MKSKFLYIVLGIFGILLTACKKERAGAAPDGNIVAPNIIASIGNKGTPDPAKEYESWLPDDSIGIYLVNAGKSLQDENISVGGYNKAYQTSNGSDTLRPSANNSTLFYPSHSETVDFLGYVPYKKNIVNYIFPVDVNDQHNQSKIDLRFSSNEKSKNSTDASVKMTFEHQLSKLYFKVKAAGGVSLAGLKVTLEGFSTTADFSLVTQTLTNVANVKTLTASTQPRGRVSEAIVIPQEPGATRTVTFTLADGTVKQFDIPQSIRFTKGSRIIFDVRLSPSATPEVTAEEGNWDGTLPQSEVPAYKPLDGFQDEDGNIIGMVVAADVAGRHGLVISLDERRGNWASYTANLGADGTESRERMQTLIETLGKSNWQIQFESFAWCRAHTGGEWYLPVLSDMEIVYAQYNKDRSAFNEQLMSLGGVKIIESATDATQNYWLASVKPGVGVIGFKFYDGTNVAGLGRTFSRNTRAVLAF